MPDLNILVVVYQDLERGTFGSTVNAVWGFMIWTGGFFSDRGGGGVILIHVYLWLVALSSQPPWMI